MTQRYRRVKSALFDHTHRLFMLPDRIAFEAGAGMSTTSSPSAQRHGYQSQTVI
jgi:hypothetical protein